MLVNARDVGGIQLTRRYIIRLTQGVTATDIWGGGVIGGRGQVSRRSGARGCRGGLRLVLEDSGWLGGKRAPFETRR